MALLPVLLTAACLRAPLSGVSPLAPVISADTGLPGWAVGILTTLPLLAFALFSPLAGRVATRIGVEQALAAALLVVLVGLLVRSLPAVPCLYAGTALVGAEIAFGNVLVPTIIKRDHPASMSSLTGVYTAVMTGVAGLASGLAVPLTQGFGGRWRPALAAVGLLVAVALLVWALRMHGLRTDLDGAAPRAMGGQESTAPWTTLLRSPTAWAVTLFMGLQSTTFYTLLAWLPTIERGLGVPTARAGWHLLVFQAVGIPAGLLIAQWMQRAAGQRFPAAVTGAAMVVGVLGLMLAPRLMLVWVTLTGLSQGAAIVVALALPGLHTHDPAGTARLAGMAQSGGYLLAAVGPTTAGWIGGTSGWSAVLLVVAILALIQTALAFPAGHTLRTRKPGRRERRRPRRP